MRGLLTAAYSAAVYLFFSATFLYLAGFVTDGVAPKTIDSGAPSGFVLSLAVDLALIGLFAVQHSVMARPGFKRAWTRLVPQAAERSTYVLLASLSLALLFWQWRPLPAPIWSLADPGAARAASALCWAGFGMVMISTYLISHVHLFGLSQGFARLLRLEAPRDSFVTPLFYRWIRHPMYTGFIIAFWATPRMSLGHLVFAAATTGYVVLGAWLEERDLVAVFGARYLDYRRRAGMLVPRLWRRKSPAPGV